MTHAAHVDRQKQLHSNASTLKHAEGRKPRANVWYQSIVIQELASLSLSLSLSLPFSRVVSVSLGHVKFMACNIITSNRSRFHWRRGIRTYMYIYIYIYIYIHTHIYTHIHTHASWMDEGRKSAISARARRNLRARIKLSADTAMYSRTANILVRIIYRVPRRVMYRVTVRRIQRKFRASA